MFRSLLSIRAVLDRLWRRSLWVLLSLLVGTAAQGKIVTDSLFSAKLGCEQKYNVYLPDGYDETRSYPVVYLLHGLYGDYSNWVGTGRMQDVADLLILSGEACPMVIVMPNAGNSDVHHYQNGYFNVQDWPYEDFFFQEFLPEVEKKYHCGGEKGQRAIMGLSMGGGGTVVYAQRHPDLFSSAYAMSAWLDNRQGDVRSEGEETDKLTLTARSVCEHSAVDFLDRADENTLEALRTVKWFVDCGDDDFIFDLSVQFYRKMREKAVKCEFRVRDGSHSWEYWHTALYLALPFASRNFSR